MTIVYGIYSFYGLFTGRPVSTSAPRSLRHCSKARRGKNPKLQTGFRPQNWPKTNSWLHIISSVPFVFQLLRYAVCLPIVMLLLRFGFIVFISKVSVGLCMYICMYTVSTMECGHGRTAVTPSLLSRCCMILQATTSLLGLLSCIFRVHRSRDKK